jgi:hypothetical protein
MNLRNVGSETSVTDTVQTNKNDLCNQCLSPENVCMGICTGYTMITTANKTKILLKVALNTIILTIYNQLMNCVIF